MRNKLLEAINPLQLNTNDKNKLVNTIIDIGNSGGGGGGLEYEYYKLNLNYQYTENDITFINFLMENIALFPVVPLVMLRSFNKGDKGPYMYREVSVLEYIMKSYDKSIMMYGIKIIKQDTREYIKLGYRDTSREVTYLDKYISNKNTFIEQFIEILELIEGISMDITQKEFINNIFIPITKEEYYSLKDSEFNM